MIQEKLQRVQEIKHLVELSMRDTQKDVSDCEQVFDALIASIERSRSELIWVITKKHRAIERKVEGFIKALEPETSVLQQRCRELEQLSNTEDPFYVLQRSSWLSNLPQRVNKAEFIIQSSQYEQSIKKSLQSAISELQETARRELSVLEDKFNKEMAKFQNQSLKWIWHYAVDVTLDPDIAH